ncbi:hypothetical protein DSO57_1027011 [Entomophthora muscae]|uniref:Uncharacterized protein n=1 Tax=Entomophthora muscae TaxID=34485 RepID=A0ACC2T1Y8_9FUNG|nr:hypothetical protein DSO57_1027011 [Entomophthora muscae]
MHPYQNHQAVFPYMIPNRSNFTSHQVGILEDYFKQECRPTRIKIEELATQTGLTLKNVQIWFQNRRARARKKNEILKTSQITPRPSYIPQPSEAPSQENVYFRPTSSLVSKIQSRDTVTQPVPFYGPSEPVSYTRPDLSSSSSMYPYSPIMYRPQPHMIYNPHMNYSAPPNFNQSLSHDKQLPYNFHISRPLMGYNSYGVSNSTISSDIYSSDAPTTPTTISSYSGISLDSRPLNPMLSHYYPGSSM